jgi:hypothetical protein
MSRTEILDEETNEAGWRSVLLPQVIGNSILRQRVQVQASDYGPAMTFRTRIAKENIT